MPFTRPTLPELIKRNQADIESNLPGSGSTLRRTNLNVLAKIISAVAHGLYGYLAYIAQQIIYDSAEGTFLHRWASIWLTTPVKPATFALGPVNFTGTNGTVIEAGTVLIRADGIEYEVDADVAITAGVAIGQVTALVAGQAGNASADTPLTMASPVAGINGTAYVDDAGLTNGTEEETEDSIRARLTARIQQPPHGGASFDYVSWALEVPGVTRAWVYPREMAINSVTVRFVRDDDASIIPDAAEIAAVQDYIDTVRPVTVDVAVVAPIAVPLDFSITLTPNTAAVQAAVQAELADLLSREAKPAGTILLSHIREAISIAAGETNYVMTAPNADVTHTTGQMAIIGVITWL